MADNDSTTGVSSAHSKILRVPPPWIRLAHLAAWLLHMYDLTDAYVVRRIVLELRDRRYASLSTVSPDGKLYVLLSPALDMRCIDWDTFDIVDETGKFRFPLYVRWTVVEDIVSHRWEQTELRITADNQSQAVSISNSGQMGNINLSNAPGAIGPSAPTTTPSPGESAPDVAIEVQATGAASSGFPVKPPWETTPEAVREATAALADPPGMEKPSEAQDPVDQKEVADAAPEVPRAVLDFVADYGRSTHNNDVARNAWERDRLSEAKSDSKLKDIRISRELLRKADKARRQP